jgi:hypothetical protein
LKNTINPHADNNNNLSASDPALNQSIKVMEQLKATPVEEKMNNAFVETARRLLERTSLEEGVDENSNMSNHPAAATATAATATVVSPAYEPSIPIPGVNLLDMDNAKEGIRWMMKGRVDSTGLAKYFPHTACDLREGKVTPEQLAKSLGAFYDKRTCVTMVDDSSGTEMSLTEFLARRLSLEALPSFWCLFGDHSEAAQNVLQFQFGSDLEKHLSEHFVGQSFNSACDMGTVARKAVRATCAEWSSRLDQELFNGRRGSFLRLCPLLLTRNPMEFEGAFVELCQGVDWGKYEMDSSAAETKKTSVVIAARGIVEGAHEAKNTCWECCESGARAPFRCASCHVALYCCRQCQESAWNGGHKEKCKQLEMKYKLFTKSVAALDAAHETGEMRCRLLMFMYTCPVFPHEEAENRVTTEIPAGPSISTFYENLGRVLRGEWWLYADPDSKANFFAKCTDANGYFFGLATLLSYDLFGYTATKYGSDDATCVATHFGRSHFFTGVLEEFGGGGVMSAELFLELYNFHNRSTDITDRKRLRRQSKTDCLVTFRNQFHK